MKFWVRSPTSVDYVIYAERFDILNNVLHFFGEDGNPVWVIKDWVSFSCEEEKAEAISADDLYDSLEEEK